MADPVIDLATWSTGRKLARHVLNKVVSTPTRIQITPLDLSNGEMQTRETQKVHPRESLHGSLESLRRLVTTSRKSTMSAFLFPGSDVLWLLYHDPSVMSSIFREPFLIVCTNNPL